MSLATTRRFSKPDKKFSLRKNVSDYRSDRKIRTLENGDRRPPQAINRWITEHLHLGTAVAVSLYLSAFRHHRAPDQSLIQRLTEKLTA